MNYDVDGAQIRAARALLDWQIKDLARRSGVSESTLLKYEAAGLSGHLRVIRRVLQAFDAAGVTFEGRGVNLRDTHESPGAAA
jgi:transcriptional regulator with XRE-family HTH domain